MYHSCFISHGPFFVVPLPALHFILNFQFYCQHFIVERLTSPLSLFFFFSIHSGHGTVSCFSLTFQKCGSPDPEYSLWPSLPGNGENVWVLRRSLESKAPRVVPGNMAISVLEGLEMTFSCSPFSDSYEHQVALPFKLCIMLTLLHWSSAITPLINFPVSER